MLAPDSGALALIALAFPARCQPGRGRHEQQDPADDQRRRAVVQQQLRVPEERGLVAR